MPHKDPRARRAIRDIRFPTVQTRGSLAGEAINALSSSLATVINVGRRNAAATEIEREGIVDKRFAEAQLLHGESVDFNKVAEGQPDWFKGFHPHIDGLIQSNHGSRGASATLALATNRAQSGELSTPELMSEFLDQEGRDFAAQFRGQTDRLASYSEKIALRRQQLIVNAGATEGSQNRADMDASLGLLVESLLGEAQGSQSSVDGVSFDLGPTLIEITARMEVFGNVSGRTSDQDENIVAEAFAVHYSRPANLPWAEEFTELALNTEGFIKGTRARATLVNLQNTARRALDQMDANDDVSENKVALEKQRELRSFYQAKLHAGEPIEPGPSSGIRDGTSIFQTFSGYEQNRVFSGAADETTKKAANGLLRELRTANPDEAVRLEQDLWELTSDLIAEEQEHFLVQSERIRGGLGARPEVRDAMSGLVARAVEEDYSADELIRAEARAEELMEQNQGANPRLDVAQAIEEQNAAIKRRAEEPLLKTRRPRTIAELRTRIDENVEDLIKLQQTTQVATEAAIASRLIDQAEAELDTSFFGLGADLLRAGTRAAGGLDAEPDVDTGELDTFRLPILGTFPSPRRLLDTAETTDDFQAQNEAALAEFKKQSELDHNTNTLKLMEEREATNGRTPTVLDLIHNDQLVLDP